MKMQKRISTYLFKALSFFLVMALSGVKSFLDGKANPLGVDKDFLALVQSDNQDSFGYFKSKLIPDGKTSSGQLGVAKEKYDMAVAQYEKVQVNKDSIAGELEAQRSKFDDRLRAIVGAEYGTLAYETPEKNTGGEISIQLKNIELAINRIGHNAQEIKNLESQIQNEIERRGKEIGINNRMADTYIRYGNKQIKLTKEIGAINAVQAFANSTAKASDNWLTSFGASIFGNSTNGVIQAAAEVGKAFLNAEKERLTARQSAEIVYLNSEISDINSAARVKDLLLGMSTLAIESQQAAISLAQEQGRLQAILDEKSHLEARRAEARGDLGKRYFADPSHRIIMNQYIIESGFAFDEAQFWVFMMARALEYKWNRSLSTSYSGKGYTASTVFALRNAAELVEMARALSNFDDIQNVGVRQGSQFVKFSLREDFFGFKRLDDKGNLLKYPDPSSGKSVDAITAFRSYMKQKVAAPLNANMSSFSKVVHLEFDTVKENTGGTFFSPTRWNEKIKWIVVKINAESLLPEVMVWLEQSGMGFIRNQFHGLQDPLHPDRVIGEMSGYPSKYWFMGPDSKWMSKDTFGFGINAPIIADPEAPGESWKKTEFHEMPPTVSKWILEVPTERSSGQLVLNIDKISDIQIWFYNYYYARNVR